MNMIQDGRLLPVVLKDAILQDPVAKGEPPGTRSQIVRYMDARDGQWVVTIHQYIRPDGTIGASGKPDPKWLRINNLILIVTL